MPKDWKAPKAESARERCFRAVQMSYRPDDHFTGEAGPWLKMFQNASQFANS